MFWTHWNLSALRSFYGLAASASQTEFSNTMPTEQKFFLDQPLVDINTDPLEYWQINRTSFPKLFKVVEKYLAVTATSTPSERLFSRAGNIMT
jgi:hypothetical protein